MPARACSGSVTPVQMSCGLKHMYVMEQVAAKRGPEILAHFNISLVIEDDQILPNHFLQLVLETLLQAPDALGIAMLVSDIPLSLSPPFSIFLFFYLSSHSLHPFCLFFIFVTGLLPG
jgi:hypothetical protein